jgi:hypothetical protein
MKDSPKENARKIPSLYLAIIEGLPKKKVGKISSLYLAINEGLPEGEGRNNVHTVSQSKLHKALPSFQDELYDTVIAEIMSAYNKLFFIKDNDLDPMYFCSERNQTSNGNGAKLQYFSPLTLLSA